MNIPSQETLRIVLDNLRSYTVMAAEQRAAMSDEEINYLGDIFINHDLYARGILFTTFVRYPKATFEAATGRTFPAVDDDTFLPLLPAQRTAQERARVEMSCRRCAKSMRTVSRPLCAGDMALIKPQSD